MKRAHILYIAEFATGGSVESLLCLVGGLDKSAYAASVLFYAMPDETTCARFTAAGAQISSLYPHTAEENHAKALPKLSLQARIRKTFGLRVESYYESAKYVLDFIRFRMPVYKAIRRQILAIAPDLVHFNNGVSTDTPGILAARSCGIPSVCHIRTLARLTHINAFASRSVNAFCCISRAVRDVAVAHGVSAERCSVVPNAVDLTRFNSAIDDVNCIRTEFGWDTAHHVSVLVGRVVSWKGQDYYIRAIAEAHKSDASIRGLIVGEGEDTEANRKYHNELHKLIAELGVQDVVRFTGQRTDIPTIMRAADSVVCASSEPEPFGRVIIEGMATGTAVIATNAGGAPDIIQNDVNGLLVPIRNSSAMAGALVRLKQEPGLAKRLTTAASADARTLYTVDVHVGNVCRIYASILADS